MFVVSSIALPLLISLYILFFRNILACAEPVVRDDGHDDDELFCGADSQTCSSSVQEYCRQNSQTSLALQMTNISSPKGSLSYEKTKRILSNHKHFYIDLKGDHGIFDAVTNNLVTMMESHHGLARVTSPTTATTDGILIIETIFTEKVDETGTPFVQRPNTSVICIQTEQVCCTGYAHHTLPYFQVCHESPNCVIWEYSDQNFKWFQQQNLGDSVLLLPTLHQTRLEQYLPLKVKPLSERSLDVVFFGFMTPRRSTVVSQLQKMATNRWNVLLEQVEGSKLQYMAQQYADSRICLVIHSYGDVVPGEYHRLVEMANSGCIPVMETFGDEFGKDVYARCGGVVFSDLGTMPFVIANVLDNMEEYEASLSQHMEWWDDGVQWDKLLKLVFD